MKKDRLTVLFYRRSTVTKTGECAIRMRISVNGTRIDSNTGKYIDPALWNQSKERAKGTSKNAIDLNDYIDETNIKLFKLFQDMQSEGVVATAQELHNRFFNIGVHKVVERMNTIRNAVH